MASPAPYSRTPYSKEDIARAVATVMGEDNSSAETRRAVASVIANRLATGAWGDSLSDVADSSEFSSSQGDRRPGWSRIVSHIMAALDDKNPRPLTKAEMDAYEDVKGVLDGETQDPTKGATYFVGNEEAMRAESKGKRSRSNFHEDMFDETGSTQIGTQRYGYGSANDRDRARLLAAMSRATDYSGFGPSDTPSEANAAARLGRPVFPSIPFQPFGNVAGLHAAQEPDRQSFFPNGRYQPNFATAKSLGVDRIGYEPSPFGQPVTPGPDTSAPGFNFSGFGMGIPQFAEPVTSQSPPAASLGFSPRFADATPANENRSSREPESWAGSPSGFGFGLSVPSQPDFTLGSTGAFQTTAPTDYAAPRTTTVDTGATLAGQAIGAVREPAAPFGFGINAPMDFSKAKLNPLAVTAALAAADEQAAAEGDRESARARALSALPQDITTGTPNAPTQKPVAKPPPPAPIQKPKLPPLPPPVTVRTVPPPAPAHPFDPGAALRDQFGTPQQFMGSGVSAKDFAKGIAAVAAINGSKDAQTYAGLLNSERPGISGVAFDALSREFAKATGQPQTPTLFERVSPDLGNLFGLTTPSQPFGPDTRSTGRGYTYSDPALARQYGVDAAGYSPGYAAYSGGSGSSSGILGSIGSFFGGLFSGGGGVSSGGYADNSRPFG